MKAVKAVGVLVAVYIGIVATFESLLGYFQPEQANTIVITTMDEDGEHRRVVNRLESNGKLYVAVNHWPRAWYYRVLKNPQVRVSNGAGAGDYIASAVDGAEHDRVDADNPLGLAFRALTGFPPRYFIRLDPVREDQSPSGDATSGT